MVYHTYVDMSDEERMARQPVMSIININAKNYALKLLQCYNIFMSVGQDSKQDTNLTTVLAK